MTCDSGREMRPMTSANEAARADAALHAMGRFVSGRALELRRGKSVPGQSAALLLRGRRCAPTSLRCSAAWPAAELASLTSFAALRQWRRVSLRSALAHAATRPALLGAAQARRSLSGHAFAGNPVVRNASEEPQRRAPLGAGQPRRDGPRHAREEPSRQAVPAGGDWWSDEKRSPAVGARSALRELTRRSCLSAVSAANAASCATRLRGEHRSDVGAKRRPRSHEPPAGTAWRDAEPLRAGGAAFHALQRSPSAMEHLK